jgi:hypothetical protein
MCPWSEKIVIEWRIDIGNIRWMKAINERVTPSIQVEDINRWAMRTIHRF